MSQNTRDFDRLRDLVAEAREAAGLSVDELVEAMEEHTDIGRSDLGQTLRAVESGRELYPSVDFLKALSEPLDVEEEGLREAIRREYQWWDDQSYEPRFLVQGSMPGFFSRVDIPEERRDDEMDMINWARSVAIERNCQGWLRLSPVREVVVFGDGTYQLRKRVPGDARR